MADKKKIILRRGPSIDLPGKPRAIAPKEWNPSLDEAEMAFSADETRLFVGPNPESTLPQSRRLQYPYRNIEVVGENSFDAFARMHGDRMREGDNHDYYISKLTPASAIIPTGFIDAQVIISADIVSYNGRRLKVFSAIGGPGYIGAPTGRSTRLPTPARYWRIRGFSRDNTRTLLNVREMGFHETLGGPNIINQATILTPAGGRWPQIDNFLAGDLPQYAVDGNPNTIYYGRIVDFDPTLPLRFASDGLIFDFGAGNQKWLGEVSFTWASMTFSEIEITVEFSNDKLSWTRAYLGRSEWPVDGQTRYIPERVDPFPNNLIRAIEVYAFGVSGSPDKVRIAEITFHEVVGGPALQVWAPTTGYSSSPQNAYDNSILTEWESFGTYGSMDAVFRLFNKSTVRQIKVTGPLDPTKAPVRIWFRFGDTVTLTGPNASEIFSYLIFDNLTWTSREVKTFSIPTIINDTHPDAVQIPYRPYAEAPN